MPFDFLYEGLNVTFSIKITYLPSFIGPKSPRNIDLSYIIALINILLII